MSGADVGNPFVERPVWRAVGWAFCLVLQYKTSFMAGLVLGSAIFKSQKGIPVWEVLQFWLIGACAWVGNTLLIWFGLKPRKWTFIFLCSASLLVFAVMFAIGSTEEGYYDIAPELPPFSWFR